MCALDHAGPDRKGAIANALRLLVRDAEGQTALAVA